MSSAYRLGYKKGGDLSFFIFCLFVLSMPYAVGLGRVQLSEVFLLASICVAVFDSDSRYSVRLGRSLSTNIIFIILILGYWLVASFVAVTALNTADPLIGWFKWALGFLVYVSVIGFCHSLARIDRLWSTLILSAYLYLVAGVLGLAFGFTSLAPSGLYVLGLHPNASGIVIATISLLLLGDYLLRRKRVQILFFLAAVVMLVLCYNKTLMIIAPFFYIFIIFYSVKLSLYQILRGFLYSLLLVGLVIFIGIYVIDNFMQHRLVGISIALNNPLDYKNVTERYDLWRQAYDLAVESPLFGVGFYTGTTFLVTTKGAVVNHPHNIFFELLMSVGFVGALFFLLWLISFIKLIITKKSNNQRVNFIIFVSFMASVLFLLGSSMSAGFSSRIHFWFWLYAGLCAAAATHADREKFE